MKITKEQYKLIRKHLPRQRGNVVVSNKKFINAVLYVVENGCKWRALPKEYGKWHTIYINMNRWSKSGVLEKVFKASKQEDVIKVKVESDNRSVKVLER
jgi:transposase